MNARKIICASLLALAVPSGLWASGVDRTTKTITADYSKEIEVMVSSESYYYYYINVKVNSGQKAHVRFEREIGATRCEWNGGSAGSACVAKGGESGTHSLAYDGHKNTIVYWETDVTADTVFLLLPVPGSVDTYAKIIGETKVLGYTYPLYGAVLSTYYSRVGVRLKVTYGSAAPDLNVGTVTPSSDDLSSGAGVTVNFSVSNSGGAASSATKATVYDNGTKVGTVSVASMAAGGSRNLSYAFKAKSLSAGKHVIKVALGKVSSSCTVYVGAPDLKVSDLGLSSATVAENASLKVSFTVSNDGKGTAKANKAYVYSGMTKLGEVSVPELKKGASKNLSYTIAAGALSAGSQTIRVVANGSGKIVESRTSNNSASKAVTVTAALPDLAPYKFKKWSGSLVVAPSEKPTASVKSFAASKKAYYSWAVVNKSKKTLTFTVRLRFDEGNWSTWECKGISPTNDIVYVRGTNGRTLSPGKHTVTLQIDAGNEVAESNEDNNTVTLAFTVTPVVTIAMPTGGSVTVNDSKLKKTTSYGGKKGTKYKLAAKASAGYVWQGWYSGTKLVSTSKSYTCTQGSDSQSLTPKFKELDWWAIGSFNGYATVKGITGMATMSISSAGKPSGKMVSKGKTYAFSSLAFSRYVADDEEYILTGKINECKVTFYIERDALGAGTLTAISGVVSKGKANDWVALWRNSFGDAAFKDTLVAGEDAVEKDGIEFAVSWSATGAAKISANKGKKSYGTVSAMLKPMYYSTSDGQYGASAFFSNTAGCFKLSLWYEPGEEVETIEIQKW